MKRQSSRVLFCISLLLSCLSVQAEDTTMSLSTNSDDLFWQEVLKDVQELRDRGGSGSTTLLPNQSQKIVDWVYSHLLATPFGKELSSTVFQCSPVQMHYHLGVDFFPTGFDATKHCTPIETTTENLIRHDPNFGSLNLAGKVRNFQFVVTIPEIKLQLDSWSNCYEAKTTVVLPHTSSASELRNHLLRAIAHETAICLDSKSNLDQDRFNSSPLFSDLSFVLNNSTNPRVSEAVFTAMNNPVLRYMFGFIRAFKTEKVWVSELAEEFGPELASYYDNQGAFLFLQPSCGGPCLLDYIQERFGDFSIYSLPLLNESSYWDRKIKELIPMTSSDDLLQDLGLDESDIDQVLKTLFSSRRIFQENFDDRLLFLSLADTEFDSDQIQSQLTDAKSVFDEILIPMDLATLTPIHIRETSTHGGSTRSMSLTYWMAFPQLSNRGAQLSSGPRPRITTLMGTGAQTNPTLTTFDPTLGLLIPKPDELTLPTDAVEPRTQLLEGVDDGN
jgi:hypothetical protein